MSQARRRRVLVACVGNVLRGDDGFGTAVATLVADRLPPDVDVIETGIAGLRIVQELLEGYGALIIVDAVDRGAAPGTLFVLQPDPPDPADAQFEAWQGELSNLHLLEPSRVLLLARAAGCLPDDVVLVGCQPESCDEFEEGLSQHVAAAVPVAARRIQELTEKLLALPRVTEQAVSEGQAEDAVDNTTDEHSREGAARVRIQPCVHCLAAGSGSGNATGSRG